MSIKSKIMSLEKMSGITKQHRYHVLYFAYWPLDRIKLHKDRKCYKHAKRQGPVTIWDKQGKNLSRYIDPSSEEGTKILKKMGYKEIKE